jgi:hypothetical protein
MTENSGADQFREAFDSGHLPKGLPQIVMFRYRILFENLMNDLPSSPWLTRAIHALWQSKNEAVMLAVRVQKQRDAESATVDTMTEMRESAGDGFTLGDLERELDQRSDLVDQGTDEHDSPIRQVIDAAVESGIMPADARDTDDEEIRQTRISPDQRERLRLVLGLVNDPPAAPSPTGKATAAEESGEAEKRRKR